MKKGLLCFLSVLFIRYCFADDIVLYDSSYNGEMFRTAVANVPTSTLSRLLKTGDLTDQSWSNVQSVSVSSSPIVLTDMTQQERAFYKVQTIDGQSSGQIVQKRYTIDQGSRSIDVSKIIPYEDNTVPQSDEGGEYTNLATTITPVYSNSILLVEADVTAATNPGNGGLVTMALFRNSESNALCTAFASQQNSDTGGASTRNLRIRYIVLSTNTEETVFKLRMSTTLTSPVIVNRRYLVSPAGTFGDNIASSMIISEIRQ